MKYLSIDIEATGLDEDCLIIEFAAVPVNASNYTISDELKLETYIQCPSLTELKSKLSPWVIENNSELISKANKNGIPLDQFKQLLMEYLESDKIKEYFNISSYQNEKIVLLGKSLNAIDLPFLNRDLGWEFMRKYFSHRQLDISSIVYYGIDKKILSPECESGSKLMEYFGMGDVAHTALEDSINTAKIYFKILKKN